MMTAAEVQHECLTQHIMHITVSASSKLAALQQSLLPTLASGEAMVLHRARLCTECLVHRHTYVHAADASVHHGTLLAPLLYHDTHRPPMHQPALRTWHHPQHCCWSAACAAAGCWQQLARSICLHCQLPAAPTSIPTGRMHWSELPTVGSSLCTFTHFIWSIYWLPATQQSACMTDAAVGHKEPAVATRQRMQKALHLHGGTLAYHHNGCNQTSHRDLLGLQRLVQL